MRLLSPFSVNFMEPVLVVPCQPQYLGLCVAQVPRDKDIGACDVFRHFCSLLFAALLHQKTLVGK